MFKKSDNRDVNSSNVRQWKQDTRKQKRIKETGDNSTATKGSEGKPPDSNGHSRALVAGLDKIMLPSRWRCHDWQRNRKAVRTEEQLLQGEYIRRHQRQQSRSTQDIPLGRRAHYCDIDQATTKHACREIKNRGIVSTRRPTPAQHHTYCWTLNNKTTAKQKRHREVSSILITDSTTTTSPLRKFRWLRGLIHSRTPWNTLQMKPS